MLFHKPRVKSRIYCPGPSCHQLLTGTFPVYFPFGASIDLPRTGGYQLVIFGAYDFCADAEILARHMLMASRNRPLSPHLQVYKPQLTSVLSITHRISGVALAFGAFLLANWVISATYGADAFALAQGLLGSWFGRLILFGMTLALFFHLGNGIRHLAWDIGKGFEVPF